MEIKNILGYIKRNGITFEDAKAFSQANYRQLVEQGIIQGRNLNKHTKLQILYRASLCRDCYDNDKHCIACGCSVPGKWYADKSCNVERHQNLMDQHAWANFMKEKGLSEQIIYKMVYDAYADIIEEVLHELNEQDNVQLRQQQSTSHSSPVLDDQRV